MELPHRLPEKTESKSILEEFYDLNKCKPWFRRGEIVEGEHGENTLEVYCYNLIKSDLEAVQQFAERYNLRLLIAQKFSSCWHWPPRI
jgi:hypothetical protein